MPTRVPTAAEALLKQATSDSDSEDDLELVLDDWEEALDYMYQLEQNGVGIENESQDAGGANIDTSAHKRTKVDKLEMEARLLKASEDVIVQRTRDEYRSVSKLRLQLL